MDPPLHVGEIVAEKYRVERLLALGGCGVVFKAMHLRLLEPCAIKVMLPAVLKTPTARERFVCEARAAARLKSDYVVKVFDVDELEDGTPYLVMEYLEGCDLDQVLDQRGPLPVDEAVQYVLQICAALAEAHALGLVHRDLKPANVFLTRTRDGEPRIKVLDFGISKTLDNLVGPIPVKTPAGSIVGTPLFMAPEQMGGGEVDPRADIWAVGVLLFNLLTGRLPFESDYVLESLSKIFVNPPTRPSDYSPSIPKALEDLILRCLERDPKLRPANVVEVAGALATFAVDEGAPLSLRIGRVFDSASELRGGSANSEPHVHVEWGTLIAGGAPIAAPVGVPSPRGPAAHAPDAPGGDAIADTAELPRSPSTRRIRIAVAASGAAALLAVAAISLRSPSAATGSGFLRAPPPSTSTDEPAPAVAGDAILPAKTAFLPAETAPVTFESGLSVHASARVPSRAPAASVAPLNRHKPSPGFSLRSRR